MLRTMLFQSLRTLLMGPLRLFRDTRLKRIVRQNTKAEKWALQNAAGPKFAVLCQVVLEQELGF